MKDLEISEDEVSEINLDKNNSLTSAAYIIGASILVGALLVCASVFYNFKILIKQMDSNTSSLTSAIAAGGTGSGGGTAAAVPKGPVNITLPKDTKFLGKDGAKVTVVEYADYQCPFCEKFFTTVMPELKSKYIDTGKIKFIYQDFAFLGADSNTAAEASHCAADQNKFWEYHDYLFKNQGEERSGWASAENQKKFAKALGLNTSKFNQCLDSGKYKQEVLNETAAGKGYGVSGTPSVFVNGNILVGAQPASSFTAAIEAALKK